MIVSNYAKKIRAIESSFNSKNEKDKKIKSLEEEKKERINELQKNIKDKYKYNKNKFNKLQQENSLYYLNWKNIETKIVELKYICLYEDKKNSKALTDLSRIKQELKNGKVNILFQDEKNNWCIDLNKNHYHYALTSLNLYYHNPIYRPSKGFRGKDTQKSKHTEVLTDEEEDLRTLLRKRNRDKRHRIM